MNAELRKIRALKQIRLSRQERLQHLRSLQARQCAQAERALLQESKNAEECIALIQQKKHARWQALFSESFDSKKLMHAHDLDNADAQQIEQMQAVLQDMRSNLESMRAKLDQMTAEYGHCVRKLEACNTLLSWHGRQLAKREALREEFLAEEQRGVRHGL